MGRTSLGSPAAPDSLNSIGAPASLEAALFMSHGLNRNRTRCLGFDAFVETAPRQHSAFLVIRDSLSISLLELR
jgi:hypothetical protein